MAIDRVSNNDLMKSLEALKATPQNDKIEKLKSKFYPIEMPGGGNASKRVTEKNVEQALNEPSAHKAVKGLLSNSPVGLTDQLSREDIENMGYTFSATSYQYHAGAPMIYQSADGGSITVYDGKGTAEMGEDKRKIVYQNGRYHQEMFYDKNGKLMRGQIKIKDKVAGFTERQFDFTVNNNKISSVIE